MKLTPITWACDHKPHVVMRVDFSNHDIDQARQIAEQKIQYINVHSPGGVKRTPEIVRSRIIAGKLADYAVKELLIKEIELRGSQISVREYDEIRSDEFRKPDLYDLQIIGNQNTRDVEVRSSFSYILSDEKRIIHRLSIYGWYVSYNKPIEPPRDFYWQVIYYLRPHNIAKSINWPDVPIFEDRIDAGAVSGYVVGGATRSMLHDTMLSAVRKDQDNAFYQAVSPICSGMDVPTILGVTLAGAEGKRTT